jgi:phage FluMu protein Com
MSVLIRCDQCQKKLSIPETGLGKKIRCPACKAVFVAAAESAITAEAAPTVLQDKTRPGPPPLPSRRADKDEDQERPRKRGRAAAEGESFPPVKFRVVVKTKTDALKKGNYAAILDEEGLVLRRRKGKDIEIPIGADVSYEGKNNMIVDIDGEPVTMQVARFRTYQNRLTETVVDFLNSDVRSVYIEDYQIPWYMFILVLLPLGAPVVTCLIGAIPFGIAGGMAGANFGVINKEDWTPTTRIVVASILIGVTYLVMFILAFFVYRAQMAIFNPGF